jgi:hypothetical protein
LEQTGILEAPPTPNEKALQATLDRETDPKAKTAWPPNFVDARFFQRDKKAA